MKRERRAVLRAIGAVAGVAVGSETALGRGPGERDERTAARQSAVGRVLRQQVDTALPPGVTLFDLNGDGAYTAIVEQASAEMQDADHPGPIHVTSGGSSTVDYAASIAEPPAGTTLGDLGDLSYEYYEGPDNVNPDASGGGFAPDETFLVVENADGRHGAYLTYNADAESAPAEEWVTFDVLARMEGDTAGTNGWFEYTAIEEGYSGRSFANVVERFGADAELVRVGVGHGNAVNPATLDLHYENLTIGGETRRFPSDVVKRTT